MTRSRRQALGAGAGCARAVCAGILAHGVRPRGVLGAAGAPARHCLAALPAGLELSVRDRRAAAGHAAHVRHWHGAGRAAGAHPRAAVRGKSAVPGAGAPHPAVFGAGAAFVSGAHPCAAGDVPVRSRHVFRHGCHHALHTGCHDASDVRGHRNADARALPRAVRHGRVPGAGLCTRPSCRRLPPAT